MALMVVSKSTNNVFSEGQYVKQIAQIHVNSFKTLDAWASGLNSITNVLLSLTLAMKVVSKSTHNVFS